jgi:hypothetical protein
LLILVYSASPPPTTTTTTTTRTLTFSSNNQPVKPNGISAVQLGQFGRGTLLALLAGRNANAQLLRQAGKQV